MTLGRATWFGDRAVMVTLREPGQRGAVAASLAAAFVDCDVRRGMASVLVVADEPDPELLAAVESALDRPAAVVAAGAATARQVQIRVDYSGADLADVAGLLACGVDEVVSAHQEQAWSVAMMGFAAGFGYLVPIGRPLLDWSSVPRRERPRDRVPAGSVALAAGMSAVYPEAMPGGWQLLGSTAARLFDAAAEASPTLLHPGDVVRFVGDPP
jgi:KipI family sensor histidine kinase inhibitor